LDQLLHQWLQELLGFTPLLVATAVVAVWELLHLNTVHHRHHQTIMDALAAAINCESTPLAELKVGVLTRIHLHHHLQRSMDLLIGAREAGLIIMPNLRHLPRLDINDQVAGVDGSIPSLSIL